MNEMRSPVPETVEDRRLREADLGETPWRRWGPYLSERQWGTVREDYSATGEAWDYFPHDHARSRAYRWGEDGLAGISDDEQHLCLALALWNGRDPILKERMFGLTNGQGNHGEDVKELYFYVDATPTHSYLKHVYKYPQAAFPYDELVRVNAGRGLEEPEHEILDTGAFEGGRYFDVVTEHAKAGPEDLLMRVTAHNRGPEPATIELLPQVWFRNVWSWDPERARRPSIERAGPGRLRLRHPAAGEWELHADGGPEILLTENDTNAPRLFGSPAPGPFKDAFHDHVVEGRDDGAARRPRGTKAALRHALTLPPGGSVTVRLRLRRPAEAPPLADFDAVMRARIEEADAFHEARARDLPPDPEVRALHRQALAGMVWSKQLYRYDVRRWLEGDPGQPSPPPGRARNADWRHLDNADVVSMPDKWEYPWYAAWDLAFHTVSLALVDPRFAKDQLVLLTREWYMHPGGQMPAYEWAFGDVNPPVHAWAAWRVFEIDRARRGDRGDHAFLERVLHKLMLNFTWWVNRKDDSDNNIFQGGFLGLDNVGVFDRNHPAPGGGTINQSDGTAWMAMYALDLMRMALELARENPVYEDIASKFFEHFLLIAEAMTDFCGQGGGLWDEEDQFYYDHLEMPDGRVETLRVRSWVGLIPLLAVEVIDDERLRGLPRFAARLRWLMENRPGLAALVSRWQERGANETHLLSLLRGHRMKRLLRRMLDETEFLSPHGVRSVSRHHAERPFVLDGLGGEAMCIDYQPGESRTSAFGGNSNWRGPVWLPLNFLAVEALRKFDAYYGPDFKVECPTGSGSFMTIAEVSDELARRLASLFLPGPDGARPALGGRPIWREDPHFAGLHLFHEYFHGDTGRGLGASHQTGWTGLVANLLHPRR